MSALAMRKDAKCDRNQKTPENAETQPDDERGLGAEPVAVTEGAAAKPIDEPDSQHSNLATLEGRGLPVEAAATSRGCPTLL